MKITRKQLVQKIAESKGNLFCEVLSLTDSKALKKGFVPTGENDEKGNPTFNKVFNSFEVILKRAAASVSIGTDYEKAVNNVAKKEGNEAAGEFIAESIWGGKGEHLVPNKIIRHVDKGTLYLYCQTSDKQLETFPPKVEYQTLDGTKLEYDEVKPFLPYKAPSAKQEAFGNKNERNVRMIALENVLAIKLQGEVYELED